jgi:hypothetical protein
MGAQRDTHSILTTRQLVAGAVIGSSVNIPIDSLSTVVDNITAELSSVENTADTVTRVKDGVAKSSLTLDETEISALVQEVVAAVTPITPGGNT